ncbi:MAG TPA: kynureninase [Oculatellaceae cyanobacterium]
MTTPTVTYANDLDFAKHMDETDPLRVFRQEFLFPNRAGDSIVYLAGNSLGLQPRSATGYVLEELGEWARLGVEGHFQARHPWLLYHEFLTEMTARLVGANPSEVITMNSLTVNLHLMLVSFYKPTKERFKILIESDAFPSDRYAVASQAKFHGYDPKEAILELAPRQGELTLRQEDIEEFIQKHGNEIAVVLIGQVNYLTGQAFDLLRLAELSHEHGCIFGTNLAHGAGNLRLNLHGDDVDFAVWCGYKYLNAGPGAVAGCFVHDRYEESFDLSRFAGWWGHNKETRFEMGPEFDPLPGAEGWQISNPPIFQMAALRASLELFDKATMYALRKKSVLLTGYLDFLLKPISSDICTIITPSDPEQRGAQLSLKVPKQPQQFVRQLKDHGVICDFREPDIVRVAPAPIYCSFEDVYKFGQVMTKFANK